MRMGQLEKARRGEKAAPRADLRARPKSAAAGGTVGRLSSDFISVSFGPEMLARATVILESYSGELLQYNDLLRLYEERAGGQETGTDKTFKEMEGAPAPPKVPIYYSKHSISQLEGIISDTSEYFHSKNGAWKVQANAARFERRMDEKYGVFRPFLKDHPELEQFVRSTQRKYSQGNFSPFRQGKAPIPKSTAVIILFMMQRGNIHWQIMLLSTLFFLIGLQPWALIVIVAGAQILTDGRRKRLPKPMPLYIPSLDPYYSRSLRQDQLPATGQNKQKLQKLLEPVGERLGRKEAINGKVYDTIIVGNGAATLYGAALLSRAGRKVLVLSSKPDASGCLNIEDASPSVMQNFGAVPFDIEPMNIAKISRQQDLMAPALATTTDAQGGIRFAQIGSSADGHAFEILAVPGVGVDSDTAELPFVLRADGINSLMEDAAIALGDGWPGIKGEIGNSSVGTYTAACEAINASSKQFYLSKLLSDSINSLRSNSTYQESSIRYASSFLDRVFPTNAHTRCLMAAIGMKGENIKPSRTSMAAHVSNICSSLSGEGLHYPVGGPRALCHAFATVVEQSGGRIVTQAPVVSLVFEEDKKSRVSNNLAAGKQGEEIPPMCTGVMLADGRKIEVDATNWPSHSTAIISMDGLVTTFIRLVPQNIREKYKVPRGLPALSERRPIFKIMFALNGSAKELDLSGADFFRVPGAALARDKVDPATGAVKPGEIGWDDGYKGEESQNQIRVNEVNDSETDNPQESSSTNSQFDKAFTRKRKDKFEAGISWMHISFPSSKDPSFESRHGEVSTCVVTVEADDDFVTSFDTKPRLFAINNGKDSSGERQRLSERVQSDLLRTYPQLEGKIAHSQIVGPLYGGLSQNPERFAAKGIRPETPYPGLFVGGADLTVESFNGAMVGSWLAANAVMGYSWHDHLFLKKNITSDIARGMEVLDALGGGDLAVPLEVDSESTSRNRLA